MIKFASISRAKFDLIPDKDKDSQKLYFLDDGSIYKGSKIYTANVLNVEELPETGKEGMLYITPTTMAFWNSIKEKFDKVFIETSLVDTIDDNDPEQIGLASIPAIKKYITSKIEGDNSTWEVIE